MSGPMVYVYQGTTASLINGAKNPKAKSTFYNKEGLKKSMGYSFTTIIKELKEGTIYINQKDLLSFELSIKAADGTVTIVEMKVTDIEGLTLREPVSIYPFQQVEEQLLKMLIDRKLIPRHGRGNIGQLDLDIKRAYFLREAGNVTAFRQQFYHAVINEAGELIPPGAYYGQGDMHGENMEFIFWPDDSLWPFIPWKEGIDRKGNPIYKELMVKQHIVFPKKDGKSSGLCIIGRKDQPNSWAIVIVKDGHLPVTERENMVLAGSNVKDYFHQDLVKFNRKELKSSRDFVNNDVMNSLLGLIIRENGSLDFMAANILLNLYGAITPKGTEIAEDDSWLKHFQTRKTLLVQSPLFQGLSQLEMIQALKLTPELVDQCLDEESELFKAFSAILQEEIAPEEKKDKLQEYVLPRAYPVQMNDEMQAYFSANSDKAATFSQAVSIINGICLDMENTLAEKSSEANLQAFRAQKADYKNKLHSVVYEVLVNEANESTDVLQGKLRAAVQDEGMMKIVNQENHPYLRPLLMGLVNALSLCILGIPNLIHYRQGKGFFFFAYQQPETGKKVNNLSGALEEIFNDAEPASPRLE